MVMHYLLGEHEVAERLQTLNSLWSVRGNALVCTLEFAGFPEAVDFVSRLVPGCESMDHHPDISISWRRVTLSLSTHSAGGITSADFALAAAIDAITETMDGN